MLSKLQNVHIQNKPQIESKQIQYLEISNFSGKSTGRGFLRNYINRKRTVIRAARGLIIESFKAIFHCGRFARAGGACIVFETRHARLSRFSKVAPPARAKRPQWKIAFSLTTATTTTLGSSLNGGNNIP